jgi:hypothetical protein
LRKIRSKYNAPQQRLACFEEVPLQIQQILIFEKNNIRAGPILKKSDQSSQLNNSRVAKQNNECKQRYI